MIAKDKEIESLLRKIDDFRDKLVESEKNADLLTKLYDSGIIDEQGIPHKIHEEENEMD